MNSLPEAIGNAQEQLGTKYSNDNTVIAYNQTHGLIGDGIEVLYNILSTYIPILPYTADVNSNNTYRNMLVAQNQNSTLYLASHSAGGVFENLMLQNAPYKQFSSNDINLTTQFSGVPIYSSTLADSTNHAGTKITYIQIKDGDFVPNILGFNSDSFLQTTTSLGKLPSLFGDSSPHSDYPSAISGQTSPDTRLIVINNP